MNPYSYHATLGADSDLEDEDLGGPAAQSRDKRMKAAPTDILGFITKELQDTGGVQADKYNSQLQECLTGNDRYPTLLHWIVDYVEFHADECNLIAVEKMLSLVLKLNPDLITKTNKLDETALHLALGSKQAKMESLGRLMCEGDRRLVRKAIAKKNNNGETCIHLAINAGSEIATTLIDIADETAFTEGRKAVADGWKRGNTPLHDAVEYGRCIFSVPTCTKKSTKGRAGPCCFGKVQAAVKKMQDAENIIRSLVKKYDKALMLKNDNDESPYMYFLRTKRVHATRVSMASAKNAGFDQEHATSGRMTPSEEMRSGYGRGKSNPLVGAETSSIPFKECRTTEDTQVAEIIEKYLLESAFVVGSFEDACACLFGDNPDEDGRDSPFRPAYPIYSNAHQNYKFLIPENASVLCQVDLIVGTTFKDADQQAEAEKKTSSTVTKMKSQEQKQEEALEDWKNHMQYLKSVFDMLWARGVRRILKVTVKDNPRRPCSDRMIRECLKRFDIRYLDWQKDDLSIDVVLAAAPRVAELTLYSSGSRTVLRGWAARNGLCTLNQMTKLRLVARMGLDGHDNYDIYRDNVRFFTQEATENIIFTRWKLLLKSEMKTNYEVLEFTKKSKERSARTLSKLQPASGMPSGVANASAKMTPVAAKEAEKQDAKLEMDIQTLATKLRQLNADLDLLDRQWGSIEDDRRAAVALDAWPAAYGTSIDGSRSSVAGAPPKDDRFRSLPESRTGKVFATPVTRDGSEHSAWKFELDDSWTEPDPRPKKVVPALKKYREIVEKSNAGAVEMSEASMNKWLDIVLEFVRCVPTLGEGEKGEIKVALIDDGVDVRKVSGASVNPVGWPLLKATSRNHNWYNSSNEHGTRMAEMIVKVCPRVELYVAKLADWEQEQTMDMLKKPSTAESAAEAVLWAIKKDVQIISMSWCLIETNSNSEGIGKLRVAISEAAGRGILMFCAAADRGRYDEGLRLYPKTASPGRLMVVGSAMKYGEKSVFVDENQVNALFPGEGIKELGDLKGSSAATALASGLAALIFWCYQKENSEIGDKEKRAENMFKIFEKLQTSNNKLVNIAKLLKADGETRDTASVVRFCNAMVEA